MYSFLEYCMMPMRVYHGCVTVRELAAVASDEHHKQHIPMLSSVVRWVVYVPGVKELLCRLL
jgi:hypothetical protein